MKIISSHKPSPRGAHQQYLNRSKVSGTSRHYNDSYEPSVSETIGAYAAPTGMAVGAIAGGVLAGGSSLSPWVGVPVGLFGGWLATGLFGYAAGMNPGMQTAVGLGGALAGGIAAASGFSGSVVGSVAGAVAGGVLAGTLAHKLEG